MTTPIEDEEVERFSAQLAQRVADLLHGGAYCISPESAEWVAENYPNGCIDTHWIGSQGVNPLVIETQIRQGGHISLTLRLANGYTVWRATLRP